METTTLHLHLLTPGDWWLLRKARLEALLDSPQAFTSSYRQEVPWTEAEWRRMFYAAKWIVAHEAETVIGLVKSVIEPARPGARYVESAWVVQSHRRRGVFRLLLHALAEIERHTGVTDLLLWVLDGNHDALCAYEALGFEPTGKCQFLQALGRFERELMLGISCLPNPEPSRGRLGVHNSAELRQRPLPQLQKVHSFAGGANIVHAVGEPLPVGDVIAPRVHEVHAKICRDGT
jgi:GNAT superfamily N-acetyltransferase